MKSGWSGLWWLSLVPFVLGLIHFIYWILTKGVIFVTNELFNINWYGKFWIVYLFVLIVSTLFGTKIRFKS